MESTLRDFLLSLNENYRDFQPTFKSLFEYKLELSENESIPSLNDYSCRVQIKVGFYYPNKVEFVLKNFIRFEFQEIANYISNNLNEFQQIKVPITTEGLETRVQRTIQLHSNRLIYGRDLPIFKFAKGEFAIFTGMSNETFLLKNFINNSVLLIRQSGCLAWKPIVLHLYNNSEKKIILQREIGFSFDAEAVILLHF